MFNPNDQSTVKAMIEYRQHGIEADLRSSEPEVEQQQLGVARSTPWLPSVRRSVGLRVMRLGARLAGVCLPAPFGYRGQVTGYRE